MAFTQFILDRPYIPYIMRGGITISSCCQHSLRHRLASPVYIFPPRRCLSSGPIVNHIKLYTSTSFNNENGATDDSPSKLKPRYPSYLGIPPSYPTPDDTILNRQQRVVRSAKRGKAITAELLGAKYLAAEGRTDANFCVKPFVFSAKLAWIALVYGSLIGGAGILLLSLYPKHDITIEGGGARKQHHLYAVSITVASISAVLFASKVLIPRLRPVLVKYGYINTPVFALIRGQSTRLSPHTSLIVSHFSHRSCATFVTSTLLFALFAAETEYLVNSTALILALIGGVSASCFSASFLPVMLGGRTIAVLSPVSGSYALACSALGFVSTFEDAGDIPRVLFYVLLAGSAFRVLAKSKATTSKRQCCSAAFLLGGLLGGRLVGQIPDIILFTRELWNKKTWALALENMEATTWTYNRRQFWGMHLTDQES
ncbi:hypothetical protein V1525DRAFT_412457 [Lipomyces kononenkoae]|uniref:Uncharacterized protein n=1 Tax=Lipomyces kononenkoae TaxID=34357 RepID=A0ACC3SSQ6_LIPKO